MRNHTNGIQVLADIANEKATDFVEDDRKKNAAQKRQEKRDRRRRKDNPNRSQREEDRERKRKYSQSKSRGKPCADPSQPGCGNRNFDRNREERRSRNCSKCELPLSVASYCFVFVLDPSSLSLAILLNRYRQ